MLPPQSIWVSHERGHFLIGSFKQFSLWQANNFLWTSTEGLNPRPANHQAPSNSQFVYSDIRMIFVWDVHVQYETSTIQ